jgi:hypothetical protein
MNLFKRPGRPGYYARWQIRGKDIVRATGETKRKKAWEVLQRFIAESKGQLTIADEFGRLLGLVDVPLVKEQLGDHLGAARRLLFKIVDALPLGQQTRIRQEIARELQNGQDRKLSIAEAWAAWRENPNREFDPKPKTLAGYKAIWKRFSSWTSAAGLTFLHEVTRARGCISNSVRNIPRAVVSEVVHASTRNCAIPGRIGAERGHARSSGIRVVRRFTERAAMNVTCATPSMAAHATFSATTCTPFCARQRASPRPHRSSDQASGAEAFAFKTAP